MKRKAQGLIKKGAFAEAADLYRTLADSGEMQPYDYVVLGDLLIRSGKRQEALDRYQEALDSYAEAGLHRNAIALAKKVHRLAPQLDYVHRRLGDLYAAEGLSSEACLHYLTYLERSDPAEDGTREAVEDVCVRLLNLPLPSFDLVDRVIEFAEKAGCEVACAEGVLVQARRAERMGESEASARLAEKARSLNPEVETPTEATEEAAAEADSGYLDPGAVHLEESRAETPEPEEEAPTLSLDEFSYDDVSAVHLDGQPAASEPAEPTAEAPASREAEPADVASAEPGEPTVSPEEPVSSLGDPDELRARALEFLENNEPIRAQRELVKAARACFEAGRSHDAEELYRRVVQLDPNHLEALRGLVEIAHINGERGKMAHWGCELGDVLLAREMYAEAKVQFERVLAFDPDNAKAQSRLKRLNTMVEVENASFGPLAPDASEVKGAKVTVRDEPGETQSELDLSQILDEFRESVGSQIPDDDAQSHYDLGMAYKEMNLLEQAIEEFETAARDGDNAERSLEMLGECYLLLDRFEEARDRFQRLLPEVEGDSAARVHLRLGEALEGLGEWDQAEEAYFAALEIDEDLTEAMERLESLEQRREQGAA